MAEEPRREVLGVVLRAMLAHLATKGVLATIATRVPLETKLILEKPPGPMRWVPAEHFDVTYAAYEALADHAALVELGLALARGAGASVLTPVVKMALSLFGTQPATVFANLERFWTVATRGLSFRWTADGPKSGWIDVSFGPPTAVPACYAVLEGNLAYAFELVGMKGAIETVSVLDGGRSVRLRASW